MPKEIRTVDDLQQDSNNANKGNERGNKLIEASFRDYGAGRSILADREGRVIAGNKSLEAARARGMPVREIHTSGTELVVVVRDDLDLDTDMAARELAYADNRAAEVNLTWDTDVIAADIESGVALGALWTDDEMRLLLDGSAPDEGAGAIGDPEAIPQTPVEPISRPGDIWTLGRHRLLCGDSTDPEQLALLMGEEEADLLVTDPPYGVAYVGKTKEALTIQNDNLGFAGTRALVRDALCAAPLKPGGSFYIFSPSGDLETAFRLALADAGLRLRQGMIWLKQHFVLGRADYHGRHESILYGWQDGAGHYFIEDRTQDSVWAFDRPARNGEHPTMKPVPLYVHAIENSSRQGDIVLDSFGGSGTIFVAAETTKRCARAVEKEPKYSDVCVQRWCEFTGQDATRQDGVSWRALKGEKKAAPADDAAGDGAAEEEGEAEDDLPF